MPTPRDNAPVKISGREVPTLNERVPCCQAETVLSIRQGVGYSANVFRNTPGFDDMIADLRRAQAEAEIRCFK